MKKKQEFMKAYLCMIPFMGTELMISVSCFPNMPPISVPLPDKIDAFLPIFFDYEAAMNYVNQDHTKLQLVEYPIKEPPKIQETKNGNRPVTIQKNHKRKRQ